MAGSARDQNGETDGYDRFIEQMQAEDEEAQADILPSSRPLQTQKSILDGLTDHRGDRMAILVKNLAREDLVHIVDSKIPAFLRIDSDVRQRREKLYELYKQYQSFDIKFLEEQVKEKLNRQIEGVSDEYNEHKGQVQEMLNKGEETI